MISFLVPKTRCPMVNALQGLDALVLTNIEDQQGITPRNDEVSAASSVGKKSETIRAGLPSSRVHRNGKC